MAKKNENDVQWEGWQNWNFESEFWKEVSGEHGVKVEDKYYIAKCVTCGAEVVRPALWFKKSKNVCECQVEVKTPKPTPVYVREPIARTVRRVGVRGGGRGVRVTDENKRRVHVSFTIPHEVVMKLGERAARERKSASEVVSELIRGWIEGPTVGVETRSGVEAGQEVEDGERGV